MSFLFIETNIRVAPDQIRCDATQCFLDNIGKSLLHPEDIVTYCQNKSGVIKKGAEYVEHTFVDEETGEECALNSLKQMDKIVIRNKFYPTVVLNQLK